MIIFTSPISIALYCIMMLLHIIGAIFDGKIGKIPNYVNIALHIALIIPLIIDGVPVDEAVLLYMISVLVHTTARLVSAQVRGGKR